jgi:hypothetical protein
MNPSRGPTIPIPPVPAWEVVPVVEPAVPEVEPAVPEAEPAPLLEVIPVNPASPPSVVAEKTPPERRTRTMGSVFDAIVESILGVVCMPLGLAILASLPLVNFIALGYLLEAGGRIARTGRFRDGFFGIRHAGRVGGLFAGIFLTILPVWAISSMAQSAELIDPTSANTRNWKLGLTVATVFAVLHITLACLWGGKLRHFLLPILHPVFAVFAFLRGNPLQRARDGVWTFVTEARPLYFFWLGFRGAVGALAWLVFPVTLLAVGWKAPLLGIVGFFLLLPVLVILPFLQMQFAAANRFAKMFDVFGVVRLYLRAPWACSFALFITLLFALPLYVLKIELVPRGALVLPAIVFIAFIWPARLLTGWVCGRATKRPRRSHWFFWTTGALPVPVFVLVYAFFVWLSQYLSWYGVASLYEQHAFLLPVPFTGL